MDAAGSGPDRISDLPDDVLHVILGFLPDATAASRTAVLSRRWRRVWTHARDLLFLDTKVRGCFAGFVDWVFAQRGCADIGSLSIHMYYVCTKPEQINEWIRRCAMRRVTGSFLLEIPHAAGRSRRGDGSDQPIIEVPSHGRAMTISLYLSECKLRLPIARAAARYGALTELLLYAATFDEEGHGGGRALGEFVTSCCPRLRKLRVLAPQGLSRLVLRAKEAARVLKLLGCFQDSLVGSSNSAVIRIAALRLEYIHMDHYFPHCCKRIDHDMYDMTSVSRLGSLRLDMHGRYCRVTDASLWLLENCSSVEHVDVQFGHRIAHNVATGDFVDLTLEGGKPFVNVRSMTAELSLSSAPEPHVVASMSALLLRCPRLRSLCIEIIGSCLDTRSKRLWTCFCDDLNSPRSHKENLLEYLGEVKISGFRGSGEEMDLVILLFESSNSIKSMTLSPIKERKKFKPKHQEEQARIKQELMKIPSTDRGRWYFGEDEYTWTRLTMQW